ncbi:MAG: flagellar hook-basal body complex protein [Ignavibacteriales bacterium]|nr:flagellar hook-basal body complex protein [Ignavibacteriota bacterium]MCB9248056.1 flagellar hook-basal body complex protein [Ignavibacteriales bacterium]
MSLINSLFAGVSGIRNHQSMLDVIGNNIANVNTIGYKGSRVTFSDTFNQFIRYGTNPTDTAGGTNTFQVGLGMKLNSVDRNWNQGTFERTGITTDLALQGDGLFVLKKNGETFYSRAGAFIFDADGQLVNPQNGAIVQGKVATEDGTVPSGNNLENITIDSNLRLPAVPTTDISWDGNLDSTSSLTRSEEFNQTGNIKDTVAVGTAQDSEAKVYDESGNEYTFKTSYVKTADNNYDLTYELVDDEGNPTVPAIGPTTVAAVFDPASGEMTSLDGNNPPQAIQIAESLLGLDFNFDATGVKQGGTATLSSLVDGNRKPTIVSGTVSIFDSLGNAHSMTLKFTKIDDNNWKWETEMPSSSGTLSGNEGSISFNADGSIANIAPNPAVNTFSPGGGASEQNIELNLGAAFEGITQVSGSSVVSAASQNGSAAASLANISIDQYGYIEGVFTNGQSRKLAQILITTFPNRNALTSVGENMFRVSANAGEPYVSEPGESSNTTIQSGALEQSNVDLSEEFTRMIVSQRGFQANSRVITVSDTLLQEITNLVR